MNDFRMIAIALINRGPELEDLLLNLKAKISISRVMTLIMDNSIAFNPNTPKNKRKEAIPRNSCNL